MLKLVYINLLILGGIKMRKFFVFILMSLSLLIMGCNSDIIKIKINSSSMEPDLKMGEVYDFEKVDPSTIVVGDIIAYSMVEDIIVTSKVISIRNDDKGVYFVVRSNLSSVESMDRIRYENVVGVYRG